MCHACAVHELCMCHVCAMRMHMHMHMHMQELHIKEGVPWKEIEFADNQPAIELLEKPPNGTLVSRIRFWEASN